MPKARLSLWQVSQLCELLDAGCSVGNGELTWADRAANAVILWHSVQFNSFRRCSS